MRKHGDSIVLGYNADVLASANFVRGIQANTGATPDGATVAPAIARHVEQFGFAPTRLVYDRAAGTPKHIADVYRASGGKTQLVARQINYSQRHALFGPADFTLGPHGLTCPNGVSTTRAYRAGGADGFNYRFLASDCQGCPLWDKCRDATAKPTSHRTVFISDYTFLYAAELAYLDGEAAKADFAFRSNIERIIAALTLHNDARRAISTGLTNVNFQLHMSATACNLKRWHTLTLLQERQGIKERPPCPTSLYAMRRQRNCSFVNKILLSRKISNVERELSTGLSAAARTLLALILIMTSLPLLPASAQDKAPLVLILPIDRATFLPGAYFDFRIEVHAAEMPADFAVTVNGEDASDFLGAEPNAESWTFGKEETPSQSVIWRQVMLPEPGLYIVEVTAGSATTSIDWYARQPHANASVKNVILFVGDGITAARIARQHPG